jgi:2-methylcitrate dehydratase PrpD
MEDASDRDAPYRRAFLDWAACAVAGRNEPAALAAAAAGDGLIEQVAALATAGHVLDFDDTYSPGLSHLSAPTAPAALVVGSSVGASIGDVLVAYARGFEAMGAVSRASHPALYERGWHPTAVTGTIGAATAAAHLLGLSQAGTVAARRLALLGAAGLRAAFGSDGKSLQVGVAAAHGVRAARLAAGGATAGAAVEKELLDVYGGTWAEPGEVRAVDGNWIKAFPCCLQTHSGIEAAEQAVHLGADVTGDGVVTVHRRSRQAAPLDDVETGLEAKFSIPYTVAFTLLHGPPTVESFAGVDAAARRLAARVQVRVDDDLDQSESVLNWTGLPEIRVGAARGSPQRPMTEAQLAAKVRELAGTSLDALLDDPARPAAEAWKRVVAA